MEWTFEFRKYDRVKIYDMDVKICYVIRFKRIPMLLFFKNLKDTFLKLSKMSETFTLPGCVYVL